MSSLWIPIPGWEMYEVSYCGRVRSLPRIHKYKSRYGIAERSLKGRLLRPGQMTSGYLMVQLSKTVDLQHIGWQVGVHRLVLLAFLGEPHGHFVNHIDGNKHNNCLENLEYCTPSQNNYHAIETGLWVHARGESAGKAKLTEEQVIEIRDGVSRGIPQKHYIKKYNMASSLISGIVNRVYWTHI